MMLKKTVPEIVRHACLFSMKFLVHAVYIYSVSSAIL